jgi:hypothetical protein
MRWLIFIISFFFSTLPVCQNHLGISDIDLVVFPAEPCDEKEGLKKIALQLKKRRVGIDVEPVLKAKVCCSRNQTISLLVFQAGSSHR